MASLSTATGIVLSRRDHREADRWYSVFTREHGKLDVLARGGHKPLAKLTPHLEMPAESELTLVHGRAFVTLAGVERRRAFPSVYEDLVKLTLVQNALALVDMGTHPESADHILYDELVLFLASVDAAPSLNGERAGFLLGTFSIKLLSLLGYRPELSSCLGCTDAVQSSAFRWHALKGGVVCDPCVGRDGQTWFAARSMQDDELKLLRFALAEPFSAHLNVRLPGATLLAFHEAVESLVISHFPAIPASSLRAACAFA